MIDTLIVPCSGKGSRFAPVTTTPKFLIPIAGRPLLSWSSESFGMSEKFKQIIVIVHEDQLSHPSVGSERTLSGYMEYMLGHLSESVFLLVQRHERKGAADSVLRARSIVDSDSSVGIWNCDQVCWNWNRQLSPDADGWILTFDEPTRNPKWSFVDIGADGYITRVAEKQPISSTATVGAYFFRRARDLFWSIEEAKHWNDRTNGEFYLAPCYNYLIKNGRKILPVKAEGFEGLGTPEDVDKFCVEHKLPSWRS